MQPLAAMERPDTSKIANRTPAVAHMSRNAADFAQRHRHGDDRHIGLMRIASQTPAHSGTSSIG